MQSLDFTHHLVCEAQHLERAAQAVLHTVCFHRFLGTVKPAYVDMFGMTFPAIADPKADQQIRQRAAQLASSCGSNGTAALVVLFLHPSSKASFTTKDSADISTNPATADRAAATSSLRAWASPRNYQYGWLAQAFSSGAGQPTGTFIPSQTREAELLIDVEADAFERWTITFELKQGGVAIKRELGSFVDKVLEFVESNKTHLPAITSADLCPYPMRVVVRSG